MTCWNHCNHVGWHVSIIVFGTLFEGISSFFAFVLIFFSAVIFSIVFK